MGSNCRICAGLPPLEYDQGFDFYALPDEEEAADA